MSAIKMNESLDENEIKFEVDVDYKEEFLESQKPTTRTFYSYILKLADEYEKEIQKSIFDFSVADRDEFLIVKYKNKTTFSFQATLSPLKKYVDWCISKNFVKHFENRFASILTKDYKNYINVQAQENSYISLQENRELQSLLANDQDKSFIELLGLGVRGRTEKGNTLEEMVNLRVKDIDFEQKVLNLTNNDGEIRPLTVDDYTLELLKRTINQNFYLNNNGFKTKANENGVYEQTDKGLIINPTEYVFRVPGKNKHSKADYQLIASRIQRIQGWLQKPYLTISNLYFSALVSYAKKLKEEKIARGEKGNLAKKDYIRINERFNFGENGEKYIFKTKELISSFLGDEE